MTSEENLESNQYFPESTRTRKVFKNLILHIHPTRVRKATLKLSHTWGLGGMVVILFLVQAFTGIILRFAYEPSPEKAYNSILIIQNQVLFGQFVRNMHHFSGMLMVVVSFLHLLRVFFTEAYHAPRHWNWIIGIGLIVTVVLSNFSGYLLPWDHLSFWAVTVATSMLHYIPGLGELRVQSAEESFLAAHFPSLRLSVLSAMQFVAVLFSAILAAITSWRIRVHSVQQGVRIRPWGWRLLLTVGAAYLLFAFLLVFFGETS